jgi:hypothetical protein
MDTNFFISTKSTVNFCEPDLFICGVGEFWNVLSSFVIFGFGLCGLYNVNYRFVREDNLIIEPIKTRLNVLYTLLGLIGLGSVFFHAHLSLFAHWIDIIFISMILVYSQHILSNPNKFLNKLKYLGLMLGHLASSLYIPQMHIFLLFGTGFSIKKTIEHKIDIQTNLIQYYNSNNIINTYWWIKKYFVLALVFWIIDYFGCRFISPLHVHWIFHILIGLVSYKIIYLMRYLN